MTGETFYSISLIAAYIAGMVALFAPCCISYLLPAYFGNVFKERKRVLFMTVIYSLGILAVMLPIVLGAQLVASFFMEIHEVTYFVGGIVLLLTAVISFLGLKLPMPHFSTKGVQGKTDVLSTFTLGVFSGVTSSCCAPVLIGVMALSSVSVSAVHALGIGVVYVLGMVSPLYLASLFIHKRNLLEKPILKRKLFTVELAGKQYPILVTNVLAVVIFFVTGIVTLVLNAMGKLSMPAGEQAFAQTLNQIALDVTGVVGAIPGLDWAFIALLVAAAWWLYRELKRHD